MTNIKPIETRYRGRHFRSRLEARWAVFFDALGIRWEYEVQGYDVEGQRYLPDFWLEDLGLFVEVKGRSPTARELRAAAGIGHNVAPLAIFPGLPDAWGTVFCHDVTDGGGGESEFECRWAVRVGDETRRHAELALSGLAPRPVPLVLKATAGRDDREFVTPAYETARGIVSDCRGGAWATSPAIELAVAMARSARFEFGQEGAT